MSALCRQSVVSQINVYEHLPKNTVDLSAEEKNPADLQPGERLLLGLSRARPYTADTNQTVSVLLLGTLPRCHRGGIHAMHPLLNLPRGPHALRYDQKRF